MLQILNVNPTSHSYGREDSRRVFFTGPSADGPTVHDAAVTACTQLEAKYAMIQNEMQVHYRASW